MLLIIHFCTKKSVQQYIYSIWYRGRRPTKEIYQVIKGMFTTDELLEIHAS